MPSISETASGQSFDVILSPAPPIGIFELNQARRAKVTRELEALRIGTLCILVGFHKTRSLMFIPTDFLEQPTIDRLEAFADKKIEYGEMMDDHAADLDAVIEKQLAVVEVLERNAQLAEECQRVPKCP